MNRPNRPTFQFDALAADIGAEVCHLNDDARIEITDSVGIGPPQPEQPVTVSIWIEGEEVLAFECLPASLAWRLHNACKNLRLPFCNAQSVIERLAG